METVTMLDVKDLEEKVKGMYREVATHPEGTYHFELGRGLAEKLGYDVNDLNRIPSPSMDSFAGVGYYFDMADLQEGEMVVDLGSGSGMDSFIAGLRVGSRGHVHGVDMTDEQLRKAESLRLADKIENVTFHKSYIEDVLLPDRSVDVVISNGVINLCADKGRAFREISRILKTGGRTAIADIVSEKRMSEEILCNATLWAACIGGAAQQDEYRQAMEDAGLEVLSTRVNDRYTFLSKSAQGTTRHYGVKSVSILARKK